MFWTLKMNKDRREKQKIYIYKNRLEVLSFSVCFQKNFCGATTGWRDSLPASR